MARVIHGAPIVETRVIESVAAARTLFRGLVAAPIEYAGAAYIAADRRVLGVRFVPGGADWVEIDARTLAIDAMAFGADALLIAHNHPSGDPTPSAHDLAHARRVGRTLAGIRIRVIDHLIVAERGVVSLRALGIV